MENNGNNWICYNLSTYLNISYNQWKYIFFSPHIKFISRFIKIAILSYDKCYLCSYARCTDPTSRSSASVLGGCQFASLVQELLGTTKNRLTAFWIALKVTCSTTSLSLSVLCLPVYPAYIISQVGPRLGIISGRGRAGCETTSIHASRGDSLRHGYEGMTSCQLLGTGWKVPNSGVINYLTTSNKLRTEHSSEYEAM